MQISELNEPIKVRADFMPEGKVVPLLIKRQNRHVFRVTRVNSVWEDREQEHRLLYFSVSVDRSGDVFQLCYRPGNRTWRLQQVMMD